MKDIILNDVLLDKFIKLRNETIKSRINGNYIITDILFNEFLILFNEVQKMNISKLDLYRILRKVEF